MIKHLLLPAIAGLVTAFGAMAPAQAQIGNDRSLIIYGNDPCPANTICVRAPESDRYRIPKPLRQGTLAPTEQPWANRQSSVSRAGAATGAGSCSATGGGGWTGCWNKMMKEARDDKKAQAATDAESAEPK